MSSVAYYLIQWIVLSCTMIMLNKAILSNWNFAYPLFLTSWHMLFATITTQILIRVYPSLLPAAMLKALTPVVVLMFSFVAGLEIVSLTPVLIVVLISFGVVLSAIGEIRFSSVGCLYQILGLISEALRLVLSDKLLRDLKLDSLSTLYYIAPCSFVFIFTGFLYFEWKSLASYLPLQNNFKLVLLLNGISAFALNIALVQLISNSSALVLTLGGIIKDLLLVSLSVVLFQSPVSLLQCFGYGLALTGLNLYREYKSNPKLFERRCWSICYSDNKEETIV
eukprot:gene21056-27284_t